MEYTPNRVRASSIPVGETFRLKGATYLVVSLAKGKVIYVALSTGTESEIKDDHHEAVVTWRVPNEN